MSRYQNSVSRPLMRTERVFVPQSTSPIALMMLARAAGLSAGGTLSSRSRLIDVGGGGGHLREELGARAGAEELAAVRAGGRARGDGEAHGRGPFGRALAPGPAPVIG